MDEKVKVISISMSDLAKMKENGPFGALVEGQPEGGVPEAFKEMLKSKLGELNIPGLLEALGQAGTQPMTLEEFETILKRGHKFKVGDIVELRAEFNCLYQQPDAGQPCVVSQVFAAPEIYGDRNEQLRRLDFAIPFKEPHGSHNHYVEFAFDSRHFKLYEAKKEAE